MANKRTSASDKAHHINYKVQKTWEKNRKRKLERALKLAPNNKQIVTALKNISYRRKIPTTSVWSSTNKSMAHLIKQFCGHCDKNIFHPNKDVKEGAFSNIASKRPVIKDTSSIKSNKGQFSIKERAHYKGDLVWA